jgi:hypothetical protein
MNKSLILAKFLAFIYYSEYGFEDFFIGYTDDPSNLYNDGGIILTKDNFKIVKAETSDAAIEVINHFIDLGCDGSSVHTEINQRYVYVYLKIVQTAA